MEDETWFTAQDSLSHGLVDRVYDGSPVEGNHDLSIYAKVPESIKCSSSSSKLKRAAEKALRDAGFSDKQAKTIIAKGYRETDDGDNRDGRLPVDIVTDPPVTPPVEPEADQLPVEQPRDEPAPEVVTVKKDRVSELLCKAEIVAPSAI
jgi:hypothetical protein